MSELVREYPHVVADPTKEWPYFDIPGCLKMLSWSVDECFGRIWPQWIENSSLSRHAVVQLALYTCPPFRDAPPDHIMDYFNHSDRKPRKYPCRSVPALIEALATALMYYESQCERLEGWEVFQQEKNICLKHLEDAKQLLMALRSRGITRENPALKHRRVQQSDPFQKVTNILQHITKDDYERAGGKTNSRHNPWVQFNKWVLLRDMNEAFSPLQWRKEPTYRALTAILNQMQIHNAKGGEWTPNAIKGFQARGPDPRLNVMIKLTRPNIKPWYTRPEYLEDNEASCT